MLYDDQATRFDERAGLPPDAAEAVAAALLDIAGEPRGETWLDVGAGTGVLGLPLLRRGVRYVGFDRSPAMLEVFREKLAREKLDAGLHAADGNQRWPVDDRRVGVVFSARALHHLDPAHVVAETRRVLQGSGGWLMAGQVRRPQDSVKAVMRRQMRRLLEAHGYQGRNHRAGVEAVFEQLERAGGRRIAPRIAARWTGEHRPVDSLAAWEGKAGLAGLDVPSEVKASVLEELRGWVRERYADPRQPLPQEESFEVAAISVAID